MASGSLFLKNIQIDSLWTNSSPTSKFPATSLSVDLSDYNWFAIKAIYFSSDASLVNLPLSFFPVLNQRFALSTVNGSNNRTGHRGFTVDTTEGSISFEVAYYNGASSQTCCVPREIYGIKICANEP